MGQFKIGNLSLSSAYLGENSVNKIYLGTVLLYEKEEPIISQKNFSLYKGEETSSYFYQKLEE